MAFEIDFLPVGSGTKSGDAICLRYSDGSGGYHVHVVDGGYTETGPEIVRHIRENYGEIQNIKNVILTHQDADHVSGLFDVLATFQVENLWMNRPWLYAADVIHRLHGNWTISGLERHLKEQFSVLVELEDLANYKGTVVREAFQGQTIGPFEILTPSRSRYLNLIVELPNTPAEVKSKRSSSFGLIAKKLEEMKISLTNFIKETWLGETLSNYPEPTSPSNECSVVQGAIIDSRKVLLTGDAGPAGLAEAYEYASRFGFFQPYIIQVPHHGSRRNVTPNVLNRWLGEPISEIDGTRGFAICSAAKEDLDHPKAKVENAFLRRGYPVYSTKGNLINFSEGTPDRGYKPAVAAPFRNNVEE